MSTQNDSTINERIRQLISMLGKTNNSFAISIEKTATTVSNIIEGKSKPGYELLEMILNVYPNVNPIWLMKGEGKMFLTEETKLNTQNDYLYEHLQKLEQSFQLLNHQIEVKDQQIEVKDKQIEVKDRQIEAKDRQIEMLISQLGKPKDVIEETRIVPIWKKAIIVVDTEQAYA